MAIVYQYCNRVFALSSSFHMVCSMVIYGRKDWGIYIDVFLSFNENTALVFWEHLWSLNNKITYFHTIWWRPMLILIFLKLYYGNQHSDAIYSQKLVPWIPYTALWLTIIHQHKLEATLWYWWFFKKLFIFRIFKLFFLPP